MMLEKEISGKRVDSEHGGKRGAECAPRWEVFGRLSRCSGNTYFNAEMIGFETELYSI